MSKPEAARYRTTNWTFYNEALRRRRSLLIWLDKDMVWLTTKAGRPGRPPVFPDAEIQFCLMVKVLFGLPFRQTTGMVSSILGMAGLDWPASDFSNLRRRQGTIAIQIPHRRATRPLSPLVNSTEIKFLGDGEWLVRKHGTHRRRQYRKVHLAMDAATGDVRAVEFTLNREGDSPVLADLLSQIPPEEQIGTVTGDVPLTHVGATPQSWTAAARLSSRSARTTASGRKIVRPPVPVTTSLGRQGALVGPTGTNGPAIMPEVASKQRCAASNPSESGSPYETRTGKRPQSSSASFSWTASIPSFATTPRNRMESSSSIVVSHSMGLIRETCTIGALLHKGHLTIHDSVGDAIKRYEEDSKR